MARAQARAIQATATDLNTSQDTVTENATISPEAHHDQMRLVKNFLPSMYSVHLSF